MFGNFSYLFSVFFLGVPIILIEWVFFYHILKKNTLPIFINITLGLIIVSISEPLGLYLKAWEYGALTTFKTFYFGVKPESYMYVILGSIAVGSITIIYSNYQDMKVKNIFLQSLKDLISTKYALWRRN